jgi:hypothetical protein
MAVKCKGCVRMSVQRVPVGLTSISVPVHPRNAKLGDRVLHICSSILIEAEDAASIDEGEEVTLLRWTSVLITSATRSAADGSVLALDSEYLPEFKFLRKKKAVTWLAYCGELVLLKLLRVSPYIFYCHMCVDLVWLSMYD